MKDRTNFYSDISYMNPEDKGNVWASQMIYFMKKNAKLFLDPKKAKAYRGLDDLKLDENEYKQLFDPVTPMGNGGQAQYVAADWKANPIYLHLKNVVKAEIQRTSKELEVNMTDKFAKTRRMNDNYKILYGKLVRQVINNFNESIGKPKIMDSQDPFKYLASQQAKPSADGKKPQVESDNVENYVDLIKNQIQDSQDIAIYNELIYKGDYEIVFEKGIKHYLMDQNKWADRWSDEFIDDIMHFNKAAGEWYTDLTTGRPVVERFVPEMLFVSPFRRKDGEDLMYYFIEYNITFGDFVRTIGANLEPQKLREVFEYNKTQGSSHGLDYLSISEKSMKLRDDAMIRIGRAAALTQNTEYDMDSITASYPNFEKADLSWKTGANETPKMPQSTKHYNVWYSWYYIPPTTDRLSNADYTWQAQFIFDIKKNQDQFRYGTDGRYSKSPLVIYDNSTQASFTDIVQYWMPKINYATMQYQNCLIGDIEASILSDELIGGLLAAVDEDNGVNGANPDMPTGGNGSDAFMEQWKMIKQRGTGFLKMTDRQGNPILDPGKLQLIYKNGQLDRADKFMAQAMNMYSQMTLSLAMTDAREGQDTKPRTSVAAIEESLKSSNNATWFVQKGCEAFLKMYGERIVRYILAIINEAVEYGYTKRLDEFKEIVGMANGLLLEGMKDLQPEEVGLSVNYVDNSAKKDFIMQLALERVKNGILDDDFIYLIMGTDNWKYSFALMRMGINKRKQEMAHKEELDFERQMQLQEKQLEIAKALQQNKDQGKMQNTQLQGQIDAQLQDALIQGKTASQAVLKDQTSQSRKEEMTHANDLENQNAIEKSTSAK